MNTRKISRYSLNNRFQIKNKFSSNRFQKRLNYSRTNRQNRRLYPKFRRNRLQRVQNILRYRNFKTTRPKRNYNTYSFSNKSQNVNTNSKKEIYVKGLPRFVDNKGLFNLFKNEGRIVKCNVLYDSIGFSKGVGKLEFANFRDAWNVIKKWNNTPYKGFTLKLEYKIIKNGQKGNLNGNNTTTLGYNNKNNPNSSNYLKYNGYHINYNRNYYNNYKYRYSRYKY